MSKIKTYNKRGVFISERGEYLERKVLFEQLLIMISTELRYIFARTYTEINWVLKWGMMVTCKHDSG